MLILKRTANVLLDIFGASNRNKTLRIIVAIISVFFAFSIISALSEKYEQDVQIKHITLKFEKRDEKTMIGVLQNCNGDLSNPQVVADCINSEYNHQIQEHSAKKQKAEVRLFLFVFVWLVLMFTFLILLLAINKKFRFKLI